MKNLKVLYLKGNPVCRNISFYRKTLIKEIETLTYLDDRPIDPGERIISLAFFKGGVEAERKAREEWIRSKNMPMKVMEQEQKFYVKFEERKKKALESLNFEYNHRKELLEDKMRQINKETLTTENKDRNHLNKIIKSQKAILYQLEENEKMKISEEGDIMKTCSKRDNFDRFAVFEYEDWMDAIFEKRVVENVFDFSRAVKIIKLDLQMRNVKNWELFNELDLRNRWTELEINKFSTLDNQDLFNDTLENFYKNEDSQNIPESKPVINNHPKEDPRIEIVDTNRTNYEDLD
jgi:hypothetical protein